MTPSFRAFADELALIKEAAGQFSKADALRAVAMSDLREGKAIGASPEQQYKEYQAMGGTQPPPGEEEDKGPDKRKMFKQLAINAAAYGIPFGVGAGTAYLTAEKLLPRVLDSSSRMKRWGIGGLAGAVTGIGSLATWEAMRQSRKKEDDVANSND